MRLRFDVDATSIRLRRTFDGSVHMIRFDCDTIRQHYDHRATSMRFPFDVHSLAFTFLSLSNGRGKLYYTILYYMLYAIYYILYYTILYYNSIWKLGSIDSLLNRSHKTGTIFPQPGSDIDHVCRIAVKDLVLNQEDKPKGIGQLLRFPMKLPFSSVYR